MRFRLSRPLAHREAGLQVDVVLCDKAQAPATRTIAKIPFRIASGSCGQAWMTTTRPTSNWAGP